MIRYHVSVFAVDDDPRSDALFAAGLLRGSLRNVEESSEKRIVKKGVALSFPIGRDRDVDYSGRYLFQHRSHEVLVGDRSRAQHQEQARRHPET